MGLPPDFFTGLSEQPSAPTFTPTDTSLDPLGDEGFAGSANISGNVFDSPGATPPSGSPLDSISKWIGTMENLALTGAEISNVIDSGQNPTPTGRYGQSAPVRSSAPGFFQRLFGGTPRPTGTAQPQGAGSIIGIVLAVALLGGLGFLLWRGLR